MATPQSRPSTAPASQRPGTTARSTLSGAGGSTLSGNGQITLTRNRDPWTYYCNPMVLTCSKGFIVPELAKAFHTPGMNGNGRDRGAGQGWGSSLMGEGYIQIPHEFPVTAFGEEVHSGYSNYCVRHEMTNPSGQVVYVYHEEVWRRPRIVGNRTVWSGSKCYDEEGRLDFLRRCLTHVSGGELDPAQIELAIMPFVRDIREAMNRNDPRGLSHARVRIEALPAEHIPADIVAWAKKVLTAD